MIRKEESFMHMLRLRLLVDYHTEPIVEKRFRILAHISNQLRKHVKKQLSRLEKDKVYQELKKEYGRLKKLDPDNHEEVAADLSRISGLMDGTIKELGLTKSGLEKYASVMQRRYKKNISSHQVQAEVAHILKGLEKVLYGDGKDIHYKKERDFTTIPGKSCSNGVILHFDQDDEKHEVNCYITWNGITIPVRYDLSKADLPGGRNYVNESLSSGKICCCEIKRIWFRSGYKYYVDIYMKGEAPKKVEPGKSVMGIDEGTSTVAAVSGDAVFLEELAPQCVDYNKEIAKLQRQIDTSTRKTNPDKFNEDGTCRKRSEWKEKHWMFSKNCLRKKAKLRELYRRKSAYAKCRHENLLNRMIQSASSFVNEPMEFSALAKRSKKTERQDKLSEVKKKDGTVKIVRKYKRKKRFGKSVNDRSPALFQTRLKQKCVQYGLAYMETDKWKYRASQYDHDLDAYIKVELSRRFKTVAGQVVQRDLYSAFLQSCMGTPEKPDREKCLQLFGQFVRMQAELIMKMKASGQSRPACFGF